MKSRIWGLVALGGALLSSTAFAGTCKNLVLYENGQSKGFMEESTRSFPEAPEWSANWGDFDNMKFPYIRLSGMRNYRGDWTGSLIFDALPVTVQGGALKLKVRSTQAGNFGVWLSGVGGNGKISFHTLEAGKTQTLEIPVSALLEGSTVEVDKIGIGLFNVPANQYTTLFIDDVALTCVQETAVSASTAAGEEAPAEIEPYPFVNVDPASPVREGLFEDVYERPVKSRYSASEKESLKASTQAKFVIPEESQMRILGFKDAESLTAKDSWRGWFNSMFLVEKGSLVEGVIPNSKRLFDEAGELAAMSDYTVLPLLVANVDYGVAYCGDSSCTKREIEDYRLSLVGLSSPQVSVSRVRVAYDPYFAIAPSGKLPMLEICAENKCLELKPGSDGILEFGSAGLQKILVKIHSDNQTFEQKLFVEVK
ncbi:MAG: hypothetical protein IKB43_02115 [Fibrobacter sp.]|nr:hypothetical protein [Fibrobacter sp.]